MRQEANKITRATSFKGKILLGQARGMSIFIYVCISHLYKCFSSWLQSSLFSSSFFFFLLSHIWIFLFLLYLNTKHLNLTLEGLRSHSQDFCLIRNILVSFYLAILVVSPLFTVISSLMQLGEWLFCIYCVGDGFYTLLPSSFSCSVPSLSSLLFDVLTSCASHSQCSSLRFEVYPRK